MDEYDPVGPGKRTACGDQEMIDSYQDKKINVKDTEKQIMEIKEKVRRLLKQYTQLQKENKQLKENAKLAEEKIAAQEQKLDDMKQQVSLLKLNTRGMKETDKKEFEKTLSGYIREIDRCIALLHH